MKNNKINAFFLVLFIVITALVAWGLNSYAKEAQKVPPVTFENSKDWNKVGDGLRQLWLSAKKSGNPADMQQKVECFVVVRSPGSEGDQDLLFGRGYSTMLFSGSIARGHMKLEALPAVANLYFVRKINLATK